MSYVLIVLLLLTDWIAAQDFKEEQLSYGRVKQAYEEKGSLVETLFRVNEIDTAGRQIFIRVFKLEHLLEVWGKDSLHDTFVLLKEYHICRISGGEGPKRRQGDKQADP